MSSCNHRAQQSICSDLMLSGTVDNVLDSLSRIHEVRHVQVIQYIVHIGLDVEPRTLYCIAVLYVRKYLTVQALGQS